jgi:hypothetical protein
MPAASHFSPYPAAVRLWQRQSVPQKLLDMMVWFFVKY